MESRVTGRPAYYRPKRRRGTSLSMTTLGARILMAAAAREGKSPSDVVERLVRTYGARVRFPRS